MGNQCCAADQYQYSDGPGNIDPQTQKCEMEHLGKNIRKNTYLLRKLTQSKEEQCLEIKDRELKM